MDGGILLATGKAALTLGGLLLMFVWMLVSLKLEQRRDRRRDRRNRTG